MAKVLSLNDIVVLQAIIFNSSDSQTAVLNRYFLAFNPVGSGSVDTQNVCDVYDGIVSAHYPPLIWNTAEYRGIRCRTVWPILPPRDNWVFTTANTATGTAGAVGLPSQTCGLIRLISDTLGKKGEGRQYLPFPSTSDNTGSGRPTAGYQAKAATLGVDLSTTFTVTGSGTKAFDMRPVLFEPATGDVVEIKQALVTSDWATQRRRGAYGRANLSPI